MPVVIAVVGILGTYLVTTQQDKAAAIRAATDRKAAEIRAATDRKAAEIRAATDRKAAEIKARTERQIKIIEIFMEKITSTDEDERLFALNLTRTLDIDLSIKLLTAVIESSPKTTKPIRRFAENLTAQTIATKSAAAEKITQNRGAILEGEWDLMYPGEPSRMKGRWGGRLEFRGDGPDLRVAGHSWKGKVTFDGKQGYYLWEFEDGRTGHTDIYLDSSGILFGRVKGSKGTGIDWTYWGIRKTRRDDSVMAVQEQKSQNRGTVMIE